MTPRQKRKAARLDESTKTAVIITEKVRKMSIMNVSPEVQEVIKNWHVAKETENQWKLYRQQLEDYITAQCGEFNEFLNPLLKGTTLTKTLKLPTVTVGIGCELKIDQAQAGEFMATYPHLFGVVLKPEYKPVSSKAILTAAAADTEIGRSLQKMIEKKIKRPTYAKWEAN